MITSFTFAQVDTLLFEDFNSDPVLQEYSVGDDTVWVSYDVDVIQDANGRPGNWYVTTSFDDTLNLVAASSSWLVGFVDGNRNYLILPPFQVDYADAVLSWKSASRQGPRYLDGYSVIVSTTNNDPYQEPFTDTLARFAQMEPPVPTGGTDIPTCYDPSIFTFSDGYVHADSYTDSSYFFLEEEGTNFWTGYLEPHSADLSMYAGQQIYIAFLHDSDDDNLIALDDILITGTTPLTRLQNPLVDIGLSVFPNPTQENLNVSFDAASAKSVQLDITDVLGETVKTLNLQNTNSSINEQINVQDLPSGVYMLKVMLDQQLVSSQKFVVY